jgi:hypothetical protein
MKRPPDFRLQYDAADIPKLAADYMATSADDERKMEEAGRRIARGDFSRSNLKVICEWKSPRRIDLLEDNGPAEIERALKQAIAATDAKEAVNALIPLVGVGVKMASAILTALDPERYTVLDVRALEALGVKNGGSVNLYIQYLEACKNMAKKYEVTLRDFDRSNWQWSKLKSKLGESATHCDRRGWPP